MRVLQFRYLCDSGGVSSTMLLRGREMERRGIANEFWFCKPSNRLPEFNETGRSTLGPLSALATRLARGDVDVLQIPASDPAGLLVAHFAPRARVVVTGHGALADTWNRNNCFGYTAISAGMARICQPYTDMEIVVVRNAIDTERFSPPSERAEGAPIVAFVGRTTAIEKDFPRFARIAKRLVAQGARVWIADPHEGRWEKFAELAVEPIPVERWERVPYPSMPGFYRDVAASGGLVLMTSRTEGFGNAAPEAAVSGARVAAPDQLGFRESIIDGTTGMLFPADASDDDVAERVRVYLAAPHDMQAVAEAARSAFSPSRMIEGYLAAYERGPQPAPPPDPTAGDHHEMEVLREHLVQQRAWRAKVARQAAPGLAHARLRSHALYALSLAVRSDARGMLSATAVAQVLATARAMVWPKTPA